METFLFKKGGYEALVALRILMGLGEGTTFPACASLLASWAPKKERTKISSFVFSGVIVCFLFFT